MNSIWNATVESKRFDALACDISCDTLVIGGGIAGIMTAHFLRERGIDVVVVEGKHIGQGVTKNSTAVISAQHDTLYHDLAKKHSVDKAKQYLDANLFGVKTLTELAGKHDFDLEILPSVIYSKSDLGVMQCEVNFLHEIGYSADLIKDVPLPLKIAGGVRFNDMAQIHPLKLLYSLADNLNVYENTFVTKLDKDFAYVTTNIDTSAEHFRIKARHFVVATHFPFINTQGFYFVKMHQNRSYVLGYESETPLNATYTSHDDDGLYFRSYKSTILVGGVDRRVGKGNCGFGDVRQAATALFPNSREQFAFATQDCITLDGVPYIGRYGSRKNLYVATGFNEWGMTASVAAARIIADMITGGANDFADVFSPSRRIMRTQLIKNVGTVVANMLKPTLKRCSHMGCGLHYNANDNAWECHCHGSRFDNDGKLLNNPAQHDTTI